MRIFDYKNRENILALISEVSLDINYAALIHHEPFLNALDVRDAQIILPFKTAGLERRSGRAHQLACPCLFSARTNLRQSGGGNLLRDSDSATGQLIKRENYQPSPALSAEEWQRRLLIAQRVVTEAKVQVLRYASLITDKI